MLILSQLLHSAFFQQRRICQIGFRANKANSQKNLDSINFPWRLISCLIQLFAHYCCCPKSLYINPAAQYGLLLPRHQRSLDFQTLLVLGPLQKLLLPFIFLGSVPLNSSIYDKFTLGRWADGTNESSSKRLMFHFKNTFNLFVYFSKKIQEF